MLTKPLAARCLQPTASLQLRNRLQTAATLRLDPAASCGLRLEPGLQRRARTCSAQRASIVRQPETFRQTRLGQPPALIIFPANRRINSGEPPPPPATAAANESAAIRSGRPRRQANTRLNGWPRLDHLQCRAGKCRALDPAQSPTKKGRRRLRRRSSVGCVAGRPASARVAAVFGSSCSISGLVNLPLLLG